MNRFSLRHSEATSVIGNRTFVLKVRFEGQTNPSGGLVYPVRIFSSAQGPPRGGCKSMERTGYHGPSAATPPALPGDGTAADRLPPPRICRGDPSLRRLPPPAPHAARTGGCAQDRPPKAARGDAKVPGRRRPSGAIGLRLLRMQRVAQSVSEAGDEGAASASTAAGRLRNRTAAGRMPRGAERPEKFFPPEFGFFRRNVLYLSIRSGNAENVERFD